MALREPSVEDMLKQVGALQAQHLSDTAKVEHLTTALETSRRIGAAIGILMATCEIGEDEAFGLLVRASNVSERKLRDVAESVVETGRLVAGLPTRMPKQRSGR